MPMDLTQRTKRQFLAGLGVTLIVGLIFPPLVMIGGLTFAVINSFRKDLESKKRLILGYGYFLLTWLLYAPLLLTRAGFEGGNLSRGVEPPLGETVVLAFLLFALIPILWRPTKECALGLVLRGHGLSGGVTLASGLCATGFSIVAALVLLVAAI
jgi:hypothetical protein